MNSIEFLLNRLNRNVADGAQVRAEFAEKIAGSDEAALHALKWMNGTPKALYIAAWSKYVLDEVSKVEAAKRASAILVCVEGMTKWLERWAPEYSTNPFSNVIHADEFEAVKEVAQYIKGYLPDIAEALQPA